MKRANKNLDHLISYDCKGMTLGTSVVSKKTGLPSVGIVSAILAGPLFIEIHDGTILYDKDTISNFEVVSKGKKRMPMFDRWTVLYPNWMWEPVIYIKFENMQKHMSLQEFKETIISSEFDDLDFTEDDISALYNDSVPESDIVAYPINDLEIL